MLWQCLLSGRAHEALGRAHQWQWQLHRAVAKPIDEALKRRRDVKAAPCAAIGDLVGKLLRNIPRPAFGRVEGNDPRRIGILSIK
jgi:hypothetical protein